MKFFVCQKCGHIAFDSAPQNCPVCHSTNFLEQSDAIKDPNTEGKEKHVPVITVNSSCGMDNNCKDVNVKVGSTLHPMLEDHFITWIDAYINKKFLCRYQLTSSLQPIVTIHLKKELSGVIHVIENCNKHGRWISEINI